MKVYFNNLGVVTSTDFTGDSLRQGSVGVELKAFFDDVDNEDYIATLNFTRHDGLGITGVIMSLDETDSECYKYKFNDPWFFAKAGTTTLTIYLRAGDGTIKAQGQVTFSIEATDYDADPAITITQYNELVAEVAKKVNKLTEFTEGDIMVVDESGKPADSGVPLSRVLYKHRFSNVGLEGFNSILTFVDIISNNPNAISILDATDLTALLLNSEIVAISVNGLKSDGSVHKGNCSIYVTSSGTRKVHVVFNGVDSAINGLSNDTVTKIIL